MNGLLSDAAVPHTCFALLDDCDASEADPRSRLYTGYAGTLRFEAATGFPGLFTALQPTFAQELHAIALFSYENGAQLQDIPQWDEPVRMPSQLMLFRRMQRLSKDETDKWLRERLATEGVDEQAAVITDLSADTDANDFASAVDRIRAYIAAGDTYQVNLTFRLRFSMVGSPLALYCMLRQRQPVPYGALIALPDNSAVLSFSPELFVRHHGGILTARPMKGTAPAADDDAENHARAQALAVDPKNRAENVMIVDLLRNDIGKVAANGSVSVPALFDVARYHSVLQMTSTIQARLRDDVSLAQVMEALYPCGSITGAPKRRTMQIIREIESTARGWYTGAIGWFDRPANNAAIGDFCLSVPIRTLVLHAPDANGRMVPRTGEMGVGAGIVHDSVAAGEWAECAWKAGFLTGLRPAFILFETMCANRARGCVYRERHRQRMRASALFFGFCWRDADFDAALRDACAALTGESDWRVKLSLDASGRFTVQAAPLVTQALPVTLLIAPDRTRSDDLFLRHKTSVRRRYDDAWRQAEAQGAFDMLFFNERGELAEGARSNVFVKRDGRWTTPPLESGMLPGVMRGVLLEDARWNAVESVLRVEDLRDAESIVVCNALRGAMPARIDWSSLSDS